MTYNPITMSNPTSERSELDLYCTSPDAVRKFLDTLKKDKFELPKDIWECACVDSETEYFNGTKWIKISKYVENDKVLCFNPSTNFATLDFPIKYVKIPYSGNFHLYKSSYLNMALTDEHKVLFKHRRNNTFQTKTAKEVFDYYERDSNGFRGKIPTSFNFEGNLEVDEWLLRLAIACNADGHHRAKHISTYEIGVKKERKSNRLKWILEKCNIPYRYKKRKDQHNFLFLSPLGCKNFPKEWIWLTPTLKKIFIEEIMYWDGHQSEDGCKIYSSSKKQDIDLVQFIAHSIGYSTNISEDKRSININYNLSLLTHTDFSLAKLKSDKHKLIKGSDGFKYCFTVKTGFIILRRNNRIFITGNCGLGHITKVLEEYGHNVWKTDVIGRGCCEELNFLTANVKDYKGAILTNPPFSRAEDFVKSAMKYLAKGGYAIFLFRIQFLESKARKELFKKFPPKFVYVYSERIKVEKNGEFEKYNAKTQCFAWFIFKKGYKGRTTIKWI